MDKEIKIPPVPPSFKPVERAFLEALRRAILEICRRLAELEKR